MIRKPQIASIVMCTVLCIYAIMPFVYGFVLREHKSSVFEALKMSSKFTFILDFDSKQLVEVGYKPGDNELLLDKKHFEVVSVIQNNGKYQFKLLADEFEDQVVKGYENSQLNFLNQTCCWPFFETIITCQLPISREIVKTMAELIEPQFSIRSIAIICPPPELFA